MSFSFSKLGIAAAAFVAVSAASAAQVTQWDYIVNSSFNVGQTVYSDGVPQSSGSSSASELSWGLTGGAVGVNRSALQISNSPSAGSVTTDGASALANTYTHINNGNLPLNSAALLSTQIDAQLQLRPTGAADYAPFMANYSINFAETPNVEGTCAAVSAVPCDDIFVISGSLNESFIFDGFEYFVSFFASPALTALDPGVCAAAGVAGTNCFGFTTQEFDTTSVDFNLVITSQAIEVPEPGSLALLGLGLVGVAALRRRRQA